jgi:hypothetical protein
MAESKPEKGESSTPAAQADTSEPGTGERPESLIGAVKGILDGTIQPDDDKPANQGGADTAAKPGEEPAPGEISEEGLGLPAPAADDLADNALQALAESAGVTVEDLYKIVIPLGDNREPMTLGALKDQALDSARLTEDRQVFDDRKTSFENDMLRARAELQSVVKLLPEVPAELYERAQQQHAGMVASERAALHAVMPEWKDPETYSRILDNIMESVGEYGFERHELDAVFDHRLTKLLHDFHTMRQRIKAANAGLKRDLEVPKDVRARSGKGGGKKAAQDSTIQAAKKAPQHSATKVAAVRDILTTAAQSQQGDKQ